MSEKLKLSKRLEATSKAIRIRERHPEAPLPTWNDLDFLMRSKWSLWTLEQIYACDCGAEKA